MFFLKELFPWITSARIGKPINKNGDNINLFGEITVKVGALVGTVLRRFRSLATIELASRLEISLGAYVTDNGGVNASFIDANGNFHIDAWGLHVKDEPAVDKRTVADTVMRFEYPRSSELGLIYNLLRQAYLLDIDAPVKKASADYYNDGHLAVTYGEAFGHHDDVDSWSLRVDIMQQPGTSNTTQAPLIKWPSMTPEQSAIIVCGLSGLKGKAGTALAADSPRLTEHVRLGVAPSADSHRCWNSRAMVMITLQELVRNGRLYNAFDNALNILAQTGAHFTAPVAEAVAMCASDHYLDLPAFDTYRFELMGCLKGEMGVTRPSALATWQAWLESPNSFYVYAATMRAAAEFRGSMSYGTDFDPDGELMRFSEHQGISGNLGAWLTYAASSLGKRIYSQVSAPIGATIAGYRNAVGFRVVGSLTGYNVIQDVGGGRSRRVRVDVFNDERRQALHSRLLFALGLLPESKVGLVTTQAKIEVSRSSRRDRVCMVRGKHIGAYLTMCRAHGWDATIQVAPERTLASWADNGSRMNWTSRDIGESADSWFHVVSLRWRGEPLSKQKFDPAQPGVYDYEMLITGVGMAYEYDQPLMVGDMPSDVVVLPLDVKREVKQMVVEVALAPPPINASLSDFALVPEPQGQIAPGAAEDLLEHPPDDVDVPDDDAGT
jgi:hypothetical protein